MPCRTINLKYLSIAVGLFLGCSVLAGCAVHGKVKSPRTAEIFAVDLANEACEKDYGKRPFRTGAFPATRSDDRWLWGWLDPARGGGYSAQVSFRADKSKAEVQVSHVEPDRMDFEEPDAPSLDRDPRHGLLTPQPELPPGP